MLAVMLSSVQAFTPTGPCGMNGLAQWDRLITLSSVGLGRGWPASTCSCGRRSLAARKADCGQEQGTDVAAREQTRATIEAAAKMAAKLQAGVRERAATLRPAPQPTPAASPSYTQQPGVQPPGRTPTGGVA